MKKDLLYLLLGIILISYSYGITSGYSGWIYNNKEFSFDGIDYSTIISKGGTSIVLVSDDSINMELDSCQKKDFRKFCYNSSFYDTALKEYKALINIYYLKPEISITRMITDTSLDVGETSEITIELENTGDEEADVEFYDELPNNAEITYVDNAKISGNSIIWEGEIEEDETYEITYRIKSKGNFDAYTKARAKYFDGTQELTVFSEQANFISSEPLDIELSFDKEIYELNENINLSIEITNNPEEDIPTELELIIPSGVELIKSPSSFKNLKFSDEINNDTEFNFVFKATEISNTVITLKGSYDYEKEYIIDERLDFDLENEGITITSSLETSSIADSGKPFKFYVKAKNDNKYSQLKNIKIGISSDVGLQNSTLSLMKINQTVFLINTEINAPNVDTSTSFPIRLNITYETEDDKKHSELWSESLTVKPISSVEISINGNSEVTENSPIDINVKLTNPALEDINKIFLKATIPDFFKVKGATSVYTGINASESIETLAFTIIPGFVNTDTEYNITVTADYDSTVKSSKKILVKPKKPEVAFSRSLSSSSVYQGDLIDITYAIGNSDTIDLHDLKIIVAKSQNFDTLSIFEINLSDLIAGKKITLDGEKIRAKKSGKLEKTILYFKDERNREFNVTLDQNDIEVKEGKIKEPALYLELNQVNSTVEHSIKNIGSGTATNGNMAIKDRTYFEDAKNGEMQFYIEYDLLGKKARAYSNVMEIQILNETKSEEETEHIITGEADSLVPEEETKTSLWARMYQWFLGLFR